jgi:hypothetical protein
MQTRTVEQVESWESRPFSGGFAELHELSDEEFSGAVVAGNAWLFMLNGRVVGVFEGTIDDFDEDAGTIYTAPHDSLPLLFSMHERGGNTRAKYFTNDTPLSEADRTLRDANFTGYVVLSENVLSGDYYVVYYGGKKMSAAFIGQSERLVTGQEAFDRAADEVGIYEVMDVSMNITEIPAPPEPEPDDTTGAAGATVDEPAGSTPTESTGEDEARAESSDAATSATEATSHEEATDPGSQEEAGEPASPEDAGEPASREEATETASQEEAGEPASQEEPTKSEAGEPAPAASSTSEVDSEPDDPSSEPETAHETGGAGEADSSRQPGRDRRDETGAESGAEPEPASASTTEESATGGEAESEGATEDDLQAMFREEEEWRQTRSIPALSPDETEGERDEPTEQRPKRRPRRREQPEPDPTPSGSSVDEERLEELQSAIEERERQIDELASSMESVETERNEMAAELDELRTERDDLEERVSNLESALQRAKDQQATVDPSATDLSPAEALSGTNLFVRYDSKGKPTLESLSGGEVDPEAVNANLKLEHHTQFEAENVVVEGEDFETFLEGTSAYRFVSWLVRGFPYELLESGKRSALGDLYEAIPQIDRIEFDGRVDAIGEDGEAGGGDFAVVVRDRMGNPLAVAELNDERDPVHGEEMGTLVESATAVGDAEPSLSGAFYVTASFFEPAALETAEGAASSGGLFSRSDKKSYVKTASKSGFHLCLVEDRADSFHVTVPEL